MKKATLSLLLLLNSPFLFAQWGKSSSDTNNIYNTNSGYVGIGTTTPGGLLDLGNAVGIKQFIYGSGGTPAYLMGFGVNLGQAPNTLTTFIGPPGGNGSSGNPSFSIASATSAWPYTSYTTRLTVLATGNVGIGTVNPMATLDVNGIINLPNNTALSFNNSASQIYRNSIEGGIQFTGTGGANTLFINDNGNVGIGTANPQSLLSVRGIITAKELNVTQTNWSDFVFDSTYHRMTLDKVASYVREHKRLPDIPSGTEVEKNGLNLGAMEKLHMQKIEELTLYAIDADKHAQQQDTLISRQQTLLLQLQQQLQLQQKQMQTQQQEIEQLKQQGKSHS